MFKAWFSFSLFVESPVVNEHTELITKVTTEYVVFKITPEYLQVTCELLKFRLNFVPHTIDHPFPSKSFKGTLIEKSE